MLVVPATGAVTMRPRHPGPTFMKADQLDPWIKDPIKFTLLLTILPPIHHSSWSALIKVGPVCLGRIVTVPCAGTTSIGGSDDATQTSALSRPIFGTLWYATGACAWITPASRMQIWTNRRHLQSEPDVSNVHRHGNNRTSGVTPPGLSIYLTVSSTYFQYNLLYY